ncbi:MAG TPA: energy-coupled thiamine transporter ThiT [Clostridiaceae bacterium]|nr:energy-coupled thiamine transporter ThiT [Clostridiaceae bacterium]
MKGFSFIKNISEIFSHPVSLIALIGVIILIFVLLHTRKVKLDTKTIAYIGVALALSTILSLIKLYQFPQGGSVTLGAMVPILLMAFLYGPEVGFLTGFLYGIITLIIEPYILHPVQVLFDYPLPFMALGIAGYFKDKKLLGTIIAIFLRFVCHVISGVVFFAQYAPKGMSPLIYSIGYNGSYLGIDAIICIAIISVLPLKRIYYIINKKS